MANAYAMRPGFGTPVCSAEYYKRVDAIIETLRPTASRAVIAEHLTRAGFTTPRGLPFDRQRLGNYMRRTKV